MTFEKIGSPTDAYSATGIPPLSVGFRLRRERPQRGWREPPPHDFSDLFFHVDHGKHHSCTLLRQLPGGKAHHAFYANQSSGRERSEEMVRAVLLQAARPTLTHASLRDTSNLHMGALPKTSLSAADYLALERAAETKSEFFDGEIFAMAGTTKNHARIVMNFGGELRSRLKGRTCEPFATDLRVKVEANGLYTYPDLVVVCGEQQFEDDHLDTLLNPTLIVEVLSETTERYDRVKKFDLYRALPSLQEYVLVSQSEPRVEQFLRQPEGGWHLLITTDPTAFVNLTSIACEIPFAEIYERVDFPASDPLGPDARRPA